MAFQNCIKHIGFFFSLSHYRYLNDVDDNLQQLLIPEKELVGERTRHWRKEEGEKVAMFLGQKSLLTTSTAEGTLAAS